MTSFATVMHVIGQWMNQNGLPTDGAQVQFRFPDPLVRDQALHAIKAEPQLAPKAGAPPLTVEGVSLGRCMGVGYALPAPLVPLADSRNVAGTASCASAPSGPHMTAPVRIQRKRTPGWRMPPNTVSVTRPGRFGNPLRVGMWAGFTAAGAVREFRRWLNRDLSVRSYEHAFGKPPSVEDIRSALRGKNLACWCAIGSPCHADVLLEIANTDPAVPAGCPIHTLDTLSCASGSEHA